MITIVDYGMGNLRSVSNALRTIGVPAMITSAPKLVAQAERLILPGVGAFGSAMRELTARGLVDPIREYIRSGKPYLGICLGLQLLFDSSEESATTPGFGVFKGSVRRFPERSGLKVPHMGWNQISRTPNTKKKNALLDAVPDGSFVYFVHSYFADPQDRSLVTLETEYGVKFASMISQGNIYATQFHPEKSQMLGLSLLERFARA